MKKKVDNGDRKYYDVGGINTMDYIRSKLSPEEFRGYIKGNVIKYMSRAGYKDPAAVAEDMVKARWYLEQIGDY